MATYLSAREAAARLGVSRQTLYAYVSRGLLRTYEADDPRQRRYAADAVGRLAAERHRGRRPKEIAQAALDWGLPVLPSSITLIRDGRLWYRGVDAMALAEGATLEDVAALLWAVPRETAFGQSAPAVAAGALRGGTDEMLSADTLPGRFAVVSDRREPTGDGGDPSDLAEDGGRLVRLLAAAILHRRPTAAAIHRQCARAWHLDDRAADDIRRTLVLCADHELNASSFTVRCVASTGASLRSALLAGLAALSGPRHGGMTERVEMVWDAFARDGRAGLHRHFSAGAQRYLPGFGHPLYPAGDPRAWLLLTPILPLDHATADFVRAAQDETGQLPSLDVALVAVRRHLGLPRGSAFALFALGRAVGWIAHAIEERARGQLIRPRAVYVGPLPPS